MKFREKYGNDVFEQFTSKTNRSKSQTEELFKLVGGNFNLLCELEEKLSNNFLFYSPASLDEVKNVLSMRNSLKVLNLNDFKK